jgi:nitroreductase
MDYAQLILERESVRDYDPARPVEDEKLRRILEAGRIAPSAAGRQPYKILLVSSKEMLGKIRPCYGRPWFSDAPHLLIVKGDWDKAWVREADGYHSLETDLTIAMDHMILAAENEGVSSCWVEAYDPFLLRKVLGLKPSEFVFSITPLGYPKSGYAKRGPSKKVRKPFEELVEIL